jgi:hypothetical protein
MSVSHQDVGNGTCGVGSFGANCSTGIRSNIRLKKCLLSDSKDVEVGGVDGPTDKRDPLVAVIFVTELVVVEEHQYHEHGAYV